jgi:endonuclease/exonuclease/phosphatase family metal-dependent hydrolase
MRRLFAMVVFGAAAAGSCPTAPVPAATRVMLLALHFLAFGAVSSAAQTPSASIVIDGRFDDWNAAKLVYAAETGQPAPVDSLWLAADRERLYLRFTLPEEAVLQRDSGLVLYLDTDASAATGMPIEGLGAEIRWSFGERQGRAVTMGLPLTINPAAIGLRQAPTHAARAFEVAVERRASVAGAPVFNDDQVGVVLRRKSGARVLTTGPLRFLMSDSEPAIVADLSLARRDPAHLRVVAYNVLFDGCFERPEPFARIFHALDADIVSLQEVFRHSAREARGLFEGIFAGERWHAAGDDRGGITLSRHPIRESGPIGAQRRGGWALIAAPFGDVLLINPHPPCCDNDAGRQREFDAIAAWLRDAKADGRLPYATPIIIAGDMNLVGFSQQVRTLLAGEIADTAVHGPPHRPDWDGTELADAMPCHLTGREVYTWRNDDGPFAPGRLDYVVFTDSVLHLGRRFVLWTPDLPDTFLAQYGLEREDTAVASDHLPVVADFYLLDASSR